MGEIEDKIKNLNTLKFKNTILDIANEYARETHQKTIQDLDAILDKDISKSDKRIEMTTRLILNSERFTIYFVEKVFEAFFKEVQ